mmetsp:Transcript_28176/g.29369  ORF Transcript_28176/g.29369 Transcript_28176/m.29369 type:complete len:168 (-) Transcript_28176:44-547(-)
MVSSMAKELLRKQLVELGGNDLGISVGLTDDNDLFKWSIVISGTEKTIYEGGFFKAILKFPSDFPTNPPEMKFLTQMWHPNIYMDGNVCISILHKPGFDQMNEQEKEDEKWRPVLGVEQILVSVISMLNEPNCDSPANIEAAIQFRNDKKSWESKVKRIVLKSVDDL